MIEGPVGPVGIKVIPDENGAFAVDCIYQHFCFDLFLTFRNQAPYFVLFGTVKKKTKRIITVSQKMLRSSPNDYAVALCGSFLNNLFRSLDNTVGIEGFYRIYT